MKHFFEYKERYFRKLEINSFFSKNIGPRLFDKGA